MATKGYSSYRGRAVGKTIALAVALVAVILAAAGYLIAQNYTVYDDDGTAHIRLPFAKKEKEEKKQNLIDDVALDIQEPEDPLRAVSLLQARELSGKALVQEDPAELLEENPDALVIPIKLINGGIAFDIAADIPAQVGREKGASLQNLQTLLAADRYTVAHLCCLCDSYFVRAYPDAAYQLKTGSYWYDAEGWTWLDPTHPETVSYLSTLCSELADLGFDEILLDYFSYPIIGNTAAIGNLGSEDRTATLQSLAGTLRELLPEDMVMSTVLRSAVSGDYGLSYELLTTAFDRIYVTAGGDREALLNNLPEGYDPADRIVALGDHEEASSYVILYRKPAT